VKEFGALAVIREVLSHPIQYAAIGVATVCAWITGTLNEGSETECRQITDSPRSSSQDTSAHPR